MQMKLEIYRKILHLSSLIFPIFYHFTEKWLMTLIIASFFLFMMCFEYCRFSSSALAIFISKIYNIFGLNHIIRNHESKNLTGASYMAIASLIIVLIFPKILFITSFIILAVSDSAAALVGMQYGRIKMFGKSLEGSITFFLSAILCVVFTSIFYNINSNLFSAMLMACIFTTIAELISKKIFIDDNLIVPLTFSMLTQYYY